jgi:hypothetical protein
VFVAPVSFFISHYFLLIRRKLLAELVFLGFLVITLTVNYGVLYRFIVPAGMLDIQSLIVQPTPWDQLVEGKKLLIVGEEPDAYLHAYPATPYLDWNLSRKHLTEANAFGNLSRVFNNISQDRPEVIIDQMGLVPALFDQMPTIAAQYTRQGETYILKSSN